MQEHFRTLGVTPEVTPDELKKAWKDKCKEFHPDKGGDPEKFRAVMHAYEMITDPEYRHAQEIGGRSLKEALLLRIQVPITFEDAFFGRPICITYNQVELDAQMNPKVRKDLELASIRLDLPAGCMQGHEHIEERKGLFSGVNTGDAVILFRVLPKQGYLVKGQDVFTEEKVPLDIMLKGGTVEIQTMYGLRTLKIPAGTQPGQKLKVKNCGVMKRGHHIITATPIFPSEAELKSKNAWKNLNIDWAANAPDPDATPEEQEFFKIFSHMRPGSATIITGE